MRRSVDRALMLLRHRMHLRGVLFVTERICDYHGVTVLDVFSWSSAADTARRDVALALSQRGVSMRTLAEWLGADLAEVGDLLVGSRQQQARIDAALGKVGVA